MGKTCLINLACSFTGRILAKSALKALNALKTRNLTPSFPQFLFCLGLLIPQSVDHLELKGNPQNRTHYSRVDDDQWNQVELNP